MIDRIRTMRENAIKTRDEASAMIAAYDKILAELSTTPNSGDDANPDAWATPSALDVGRQRLTGKSAKPTTEDRRSSPKASEQRRRLIARLLVDGPKKLSDIMVATNIPQSSLISVLRHHSWFQESGEWGKYQLTKSGEAATRDMLAGREPAPAE